MGSDERRLRFLEEGYAAYNRGDFDAAAARWVPDIEVKRVTGLGELRGDQARRWLEPDAFDWQRIEPSDYRVSGDRVFVAIHVTARGAGSSLEVEQELFQVWEFDDEDRTVRLENYLDRDEALAAAGLT
jgi:ketosteroid isomerase-like protein